MARLLQDDNLLTWEAYASTGSFGYSERPHIVFHCTTDPLLRARFVEREGDRADAERAIATLSDSELTALFSEARELD